MYIEFYKDDNDPIVGDIVYNKRDLKRSDLMYVK